MENRKRMKLVLDKKQLETDAYHSGGTYILNFNTEQKGSEIARE